MLPDLFSQLSARIADVAERAARSVVRVEARRRGPSSGVAWREDGLVLTAHHAVERDEDVEVGLPSGDVAAAEVVGHDPSTDLALLRVAAAVEPPAWNEVAAPRPGELVIGVSRPGRLPRAGVAAVTCAGGEFRAPGGGRIDRYVETSLPLHPGVSGALVTAADGSALGLALAGMARGAAIAVPLSTLRRVATALAAHGEVRRGYLGLATVPVPLPPPLRASTGEHLALLVTRVEPDGPAARAGIVLGDALLSFGGRTLQDPSELLTLLADDRIGDVVPMKLLRAGEARDVEVTVGARPRGAAR